MIDLPNILGISTLAVYILLFIVLVKILLIINGMKTKEMILGFGITGLLNLVAVWSVGGDTIIEWGFYIAMVALLAFSCITRLVIGNTGKESESVDWDAIGSYCTGSVIAFALTLVIYWVCG